MEKDTFDLCKEFCDYAHLQDNMAAECPNIFFGLAHLRLKQEEVAKWIKGWNWHNWDPLDDPLTMISPQMLAYIVLVAKSFWKRKEESSDESKNITKEINNKEEE